MDSTSAIPASSPVTASAAADVSSEDTDIFGDDGFTFEDFIDIINPFHHIPIVGTVYRNETEDTIADGPRVMGGTLFGGPIGLVSSLINVWVENETGKDMTEHVYAYFSDEGGEDEALDSEFVTAAGEAPKGHHYRDVSDWAKQEIAYRQALAAQAPRLGTQTPSLVAAAVEDPIPNPAFAAEPAATVSDGAGLGTKLFAQALRTPEDARPVFQPLPRPDLTQYRPQEEPAAAGAQPKPAQVTSPPGSAAPTDLDARLQALAARNPWPTAADTSADSGGGWFSQAMLNGLDKYLTGPAAP